MYKKNCKKKIATESRSPQSHRSVAKYIFLSSNAIKKRVVALKGCYTVTTYNIEARYPETKEALARKLDKDACRIIIDGTQTLQIWIKEQLSNATKH